MIPQRCEGHRYCTSRRLKDGHWHWTLYEFRDGRYRHAGTTRNYPEAEEFILHKRPGATKRPANNIQSSTQ